MEESKTDSSEPTLCEELCDDPNIKVYDNRKQILVHDPYTNTQIKREIKPEDPDAKKLTEVLQCTALTKYLGEKPQLDQFTNNSNYRETTLKGFCSNKNYLETHKKGGTRGKKRRNTKKRKNTKKRRNIKKR